jgi:hypothetical protein
MRATFWDLVYVPLRDARRHRHVYREEYLPHMQPFKAQIGVSACRHWGGAARTTYSVIPCVFSCTQNLKMRFR